MTSRDSKKVTSGQLGRARSKMEREISRVQQALAQYEVAKEEFHKAYVQSQIAEGHSAEEARRFIKSIHRATSDLFMLTPGIDYAATKKGTREGFYLDVSFPYDGKVEDDTQLLEQIVGRECWYSETTFGGPDHMMREVGWEFADRPSAEAGALKLREAGYERTSIRAKSG